MKEKLALIVLSLLLTILYPLYVWIMLLESKTSKEFIDFHKDMAKLFIEAFSNKVKKWLT